MGQRPGDEVVQLYVRDRTASVTRPIKELKGFERVTLAPGESRAVRMTLKPAAFAPWNLDMVEVVETRLFDIMTGPDSENLQKTTLAINGTGTSPCTSTTMRRGPKRHTCKTKPQIDTTK